MIVHDELAAPGAKGKLGKRTLATENLRLHDNLTASVMGIGGSVFKYGAKLMILSI